MDCKSVILLLIATFVAFVKSQSSCVSCVSSFLSSTTCGAEATSSSRVSCSGKCYVQISRSIYGSSLTYMRGCLPADSCTDEKTSLLGRKCCEGDECNKDGSDAMPEGYTTCWICSGDGKNTCKKHDYDPNSDAGSTLKTCQGKCSKYKTKFLGAESWYRDCDATCTEGDFDGFGNLGTGERWCCDGNKCNTSTKNAIKVGSVMMGVLISLTAFALKA